MSTSRIEAFSDGVFAIAITLLVLNLRVPVQASLHFEHQSLVRALLDQWPAYASYVVSFLTIGIIWVNHHAMFHLVGRSDRTLLFLNLLLLMTVAVIPFPTAVLAEYLTGSSGRDANTAAFVYGIAMTAMSIAFALLWNHVVSGKGLLAEGVDRDQARRTVRRFEAGLVVYPATMLIALISAPATLALYLGLAVYYMFNQLPVSAEGQGH